MNKSQTLSKLLKLKEEKKRELELEVKKMNEKVDSEYSKLTAFTREYSDTLELFKKKNAETYVNSYDITSLYNYLAHLNNLMQEQKKTYLQRLTELKALSNSLIAAHRDKKIFEKLTDRANKKEIKDKNSSEQKRTDFATITRYSIKKNSG